MKYREIPIDDSKGIDQFWIGDMVRVYGPNGRVGSGYIGDIIFNETIVFEYKLLGSFKHNFRCCRKLEPVEPREIWLVKTTVNSQEEYHSELPLSYFQAIKFREVLEDE